MKLCVDCLHFAPDMTFRNTEGQTKHARCLFTAKVSMVDGTTQYRGCEVERHEANMITIDRCGVAGKYFHLKEI